MDSDRGAETTLGLLGVEWRLVEPSDYDLICDWVNRRRELGLIGSEDSPALTPEILHRWVATAVCAVLFEVGGIPVAFGTGSRSEGALPEDTVEICHFIVAPPSRRLYFGSTFLRVLAFILQHGYGFTTVVARVVPTNVPALSNLLYLRWREITDAHSWTTGTPFRWFTPPRPKSVRSTE